MQRGSFKHFVVKMSELKRHTISSIVWSFLVLICFSSCSDKMSESDRAEIVKTLIEKITPIGIGDFKYEQPMSEVALSQNDSSATPQAINLCHGVGILRYDIPDSKGKYGSPLRIAACSDLEMGKEYYTSSGGIIHKWNPKSKLKFFHVQIHSKEGDWVNPLLNNIVNGFIKSGYTVDSREVNDPKTAVLLSKGNFNLFIMDNGKNDIDILCGYNLKEMKAYSDFRELFLSPKIGVWIY